MRGYKAKEGMKEIKKGKEKKERKGKKERKERILQPSKTREGEPQSGKKETHL